MKLKIFSFLFVLCIVLFSCNKTSRVEKRIQGDWVLEEMRIIDGQGFTYYLSDVSGELSLNFENNSSDGGATFQNESINNGQLFTTHFSGDSLELSLESNVLYIGENQERRAFSLILYNSNDLVLEYYDFLSYQLRKYIFTRN